MTEQKNQPMNSVSRRDVLAAIGGSLSLAGLAGCDDFPDENVVPYVNQPESVVPGRPNFYATAIPLNGFGIGALVETHEGRPTKIEGNPDHPASLGAANVFMQASVLDLYDSDRSKLITHGGIASTWGSFYDELVRHLHRTGGQGLRILSRTITSPTFAEQLAGLHKRFPDLRWHVHDPVALAGCSGRISGSPYRAVYDFSKADVILSLDSDFLINDSGSLAYARQFADGRRRRPDLSADQQTMNRLYVIESAMTLTGSMADHRMAVRPSRVLVLARAIAAKLREESGVDAALSAEEARFVDAVAADLQHPQMPDRPSGYRGMSVVVAGDNQPAELQALAMQMNRALRSVGGAVRYIDPPEVTGAESIDALVADMNAGKVRTLLILGGNPAYDAPVDLNFETALRRLSTVSEEYFTAHLSAYEDETSFGCQWHIPESHYLECWGDARAFDGSASLIQPAILPMSPASRSICQMMETLLGRPDRSEYEAVRSTWQTWHSKADGSSTFEQWWRSALRKGVIDNSALPSNEVATTSESPATPPAPTADSSQWEIVFTPDPTIWDGQYANNPWLQELPKPFSKLVWDNAVYISHKSAQSLGVRDGDVVRITTADRTLDVPVAIVPGTAERTLILSLGYGRTRAGSVANPESATIRGYNAYLLRTSQAEGFATGATVAKLVGASASLVMTRSHHAMDESADHSDHVDLSAHAIEHPGMSAEQVELHNRKLVRAGTLADFHRDPDWVTRLGGDIEMRAKGLSKDFPDRKIHLTIYPDSAHGGWDYSKGHQWAMSIDQNTCIGCNACVVACQAENNIPVVGKEECSRQREMHWIRIDSWLAAPSDDAMTEPQIVHMPVPCQHCENAPCEVVCPVGATTHSVEGLNEMTYNRCIGTRYCSNNCPYKVRRFNFFLYSDYSSPSRALQYNPEVTVRSRGVMEKCTYCVQRLTHTRLEIEKLTVELEQRAKIVEHDSPEQAAAIRGSIPQRQKQVLGQLQTACQQSCPTRAITFGDKNDPDSAVTKLKADKLDYTLLSDLTTQPRTSYMAKLRNPNPSLSGA